MRHILFAHPNKKLLEIYRQRLTPLIRLDSAYNGLDAVRKIRLYKPLLVVSELHLPFLSGLSVLQYVRNHKTISHIPFVFLSDAPFAHEALSLGANEWLDSKTHSIDTVTAKIFYHLHIK